MKKILINILCLFIPSKHLRHNIRDVIMHKREMVYFTLRPYRNKGKNNKIIIVKDGKKKRLSRFQKISNLDITFCGNNNLIIIEFPFKLRTKSFINITDNGNKNKVYIKENFNGMLFMTISFSFNSFICGKNVWAGQLHIWLCSLKLSIGNDCMISGNIYFQSDGHCILDLKSSKVLNKQKNILKIGNHCWVGFSVSFLKDAQVPDDCVVAFGSIVTKKFDKPHCVIAGNPAKIVKEGVSWSRLSIYDYEKKLLK